ncbi:TPA: P-type conjugative transfer protein TrbL [Escherichia coli]|uniref:P-type conjugative transfer protein TrbL n=1 Tax=Enterobacteriaceae TaxID=543 RepID=UPI00058D5291|nr:MULTISPECIES: P-type conjugative transfer protein TrbL [Enterobacteriaceae]HCF5160160.1 P-type conjugative transfer protein TrbL [Pseudomonas aeruginosa]EFN8827707.1 P-type conjugative transfer protein TrbL [Escherichia coli]EIH9906327.1 P-type conjugative transfer protein TrbL [Escherichia coli]EKY4221096.1 P-type conjugative transfer protein TrbL [Escherichia coli]ELE8675898.1 P-type conjugative transfer protein TrbL [Escherichia coli]
MRRSTVYALVGAVLLLSATSAMAAGVDLAQSNTSMNSLLRLIQNASNQWAPRLHDYALWLLGCLAVIQLVWTFAPLVMRGAELGDILHELVKFILVIGFFYAMLDHATEWGGAIINSFRQAGAHAAGLGSAELMPGDMFSTAVDFSRQVLTAGVSMFSPITSVVVAVSALIVLMCFTFIAALVFVTLVEAYVIINAAVLFMGFGGSQWTREYALAPIRYAVAVGAKLFVLTLIVGLIMQVSAEWSAAYTNDEASLMTLVGLSLVCAYLTKTIPELIGGMISGTSMGGGSAIGGMAAAGAAGAAAAVATVATAGAAAPAAGALGAAGTGGGAASAAGGGLASALNASMAGGSTAGGSGAAAKAAGSRVGGGAASGSANPVSAAASPASQEAGSGLKQAAKQAGRAAKGGDDDTDQQAVAQQRQMTPKEGTGGNGKVVAQGAEVATRALGVLGAISVPGMESSHGLSLGGTGSPPPVPGGDSPTPDDGAEPTTQAESNIIRPTSDTARTGNVGALNVPGMDSGVNSQSEA